jgi:hypothetical protein
LNQDGLNQDGSHSEIAHPNNGKRGTGLFETNKLLSKIRQKLHKDYHTPNNSIEEEKSF